jgi:hypothetical protein
MIECDWGGGAEEVVEVREVTYYPRRCGRLIGSSRSLNYSRGNKEVMASEWMSSAMLGGKLPTMCKAGRVEDRGEYRGGYQAIIKRVWSHFNGVSSKKGSEGKVQPLGPKRQSDRHKEAWLSLRRSGWPPRRNKCPG